MDGETIPIAAINVADDAISVADGGAPLIRCKNNVNSAQQQHSSFLASQLVIEALSDLLGSHDTKPKTLNYEQIPINIR